MLFAESPRATHYGRKWLRRKVRSEPAGPGFTEPDIDRPCRNNMTGEVMGHLTITP